MKAVVVCLLTLLLSVGAFARQPYRDYLPGLPSAPQRPLESDSEFFSQDHQDEAHFFAKVSKEPYVQAVRTAAQGDGKRLSKVFESAKYQDGAGAEGYASTLFWLMHRVGDKQFATVLRAQPSTARKRIVALLDYGSEYDYSATFPQTFHAARHEPQ